MSAKPFLDYSTRTAVAQALRAQGKSIHEIAGLLNVAVKTASALLISGDRPRRVRPAEEMGRTVVIPLDVLDSLAPYAARRSMSVNALVRRIVETVADEAMIDAVLDDSP